MLERLLSHFYTPPSMSKTLAGGTIAVCCVAIAWFVFATGGAKFATLHLMYMPTHSAALVSGAGGGIAAGVVAGLLLGPYMPLDTVTGEAQNPEQLALPRPRSSAWSGGVVGVGAGDAAQGSCCCPPLVE